MEQQTTFIPDGMNAFERYVKRVGDCMIAGILMIIFSPLLILSNMIFLSQNPHHDSRYNIHK